MDGVVHKESKPIKDAKEAYAITKGGLKSFGNATAKTFDKGVDKMKPTANKIGKSISSFWGKVTGKKKEEQD